MRVKKQKIFPVRFRQPYDRFNSKDLIIRDYLAIQRTNLSNERTFLAYIRTFVGLLAVGVTFIKLLDAKFLIIVGVILVAFAIVSLVVGVINYFKRKKQIPRLSELEGENEILKQK